MSNDFDLDWIKQIFDVMGRQSNADEPVSRIRSTDDRWIEDRRPGGEDYTFVKPHHPVPTPQAQSVIDAGQRFRRRDQALAQARDARSDNLRRALARYLTQRAM